MYVQDQSPIEWGIVDAMIRTYCKQINLFQTLTTAQKQQIPISTAALIDRK